MKLVRVALALACLATPAMAGAQVKLSVRTHIDSYATDDPSYSPASRLTSDPGFRSWKGEQNARLTSYSYRPLLRFAECISRFDKRAADRVLGTPLSSARSTSTLNFAAAANRGCIVERGMVHPLLLRAALAETLLKDNRGIPAFTAVKAPVGMPAVVDGYPLRRIAECQVGLAPELVRRLLATQPSGPDERLAAETIFQKTAACGAPTLGRLSPTAARLALVEAEYGRRFVRQH